MKSFGIRLRLAACVVALALLAFVVPAGCQPSGASGTTKAQKMDALLEAYNRYHEFNGSVLVAEHGKVILRKGYGMADLEWSVPNSPETKFRLGSVTKQFTATLIVKLVERGKLALDGKLADYLPYYRKDVGTRLTIENLLTHTSGLPNYTDRPDYATLDVHPYAPEEFVKQYCSGDLQFEPGSKFQYSNSNYFILGALIEQLTGKPYKQVLREEILQPLGMNDSGYDEFPVVLPQPRQGLHALCRQIRERKVLRFFRPLRRGIALFHRGRSLQMGPGPLHRCCPSGKIQSHHVSAAPAELCLGLVRGQSSRGPTRCR